MPEAFDLVVLGSGSAGQKPAYACAKAGWSVAVIERQEPGGTCANRGCDAKKPLVNAAAALAQAQRLTGRGLEGELRVDWPSLMRFKRSFTDPIPGRTADDLAAAGIELIAGSPCFTGPTTIAVGDRELRARHVVIATGITPRPLDMPGEELLATSDDFLELEHLPPRIVFVGGGYVSMEFAHVAAHAGSRVTVVERRGCPMKQFDADMAARLGEASRRLGIDLRCSTVVTAIERTATGFAAVCGDSGERFEADLIVHGAGRVPSVLEMDLAAAGVEHTDRGVTVNAHFQSVSNPAVYAAGDVADTGALRLTPPSGVEGKVVAVNLLRGNVKTADYGPVATVVFTEPPLAEVGLTEAQAKAQGRAVRVHHGEGSGWKHYRQLGRDQVAYKILVDPETDLILGAVFLGPEAGDVVNALTIAMRAGLTASRLRTTLFAYPTQASLFGAMLKDA